MKKFFFILTLFIFTGCAGVVIDKTAEKIRMPVNLQTNDVLISFIIDCIDFKKWQEDVLNNAANLARRHNITFDLATYAEPFLKKHKETWRIYENNQDLFEIIAFGVNNINPVDKGRKGEFYDITYKQEIPEYMQEEKIKKMKEIFEKNNIKSATEIFLVPWFSGDENTIKIAEKYGYKLIIQENIDKSGNLVMNYNKITASKCYINVPYRENITEKDIKYMKAKIQNLIDNRIKRIYIILHPVNFKTFNAVNYTDKFINEIIFKFKSVNVVIGMVTDGTR